VNPVSANGVDMDAPISRILPVRHRHKLFSLSTRTGADYGVPTGPCQRDPIHETAIPILTRAVLQRSDPSAVRHRDRFVDAPVRQWH
jgi:hypothetical protein